MRHKSDVVAIITTHPSGLSLALSHHNELSCRFNVILYTLVCRVASKGSSSSSSSLHYLPSATYRLFLLLFENVFFKVLKVVLFYFSSWDLQNLLGHVSRNTKHTLNRLGVFTVSSFHAYICARSPSLLNNLLAGRGATRRRPPIAPVLSRSNSLSSRKSQSMAAAAAAAAAANASMGHESGDKLFRVSLSDGQTATVSLKDNMTVEEFLAMACGKRGLNSAEHFVRVKKRREMDNSNHFVPHRTDLIDSYVPSHELVEICAKALYRVELSRNNVDQMWGFSVEAELVENAERQDELCVFVSRVEDRSVAMNHGTFFFLILSPPFPIPSINNVSTHTPSLGPSVQLGNGWMDVLIPSNFIHPPEHNGHWRAHPPSIP